MIKSLFDHSKEDGKELWNNDTALLDAYLNLKKSHSRSVTVDPCLHVIVKAMKNGDKFSGHPYFKSILHNASLLMESKAFVMSMNARNSGLCCSLHFFCS